MPVTILVIAGSLAALAVWILTIARANDAGFAAGFRAGRRLHDPEEPPR